jgi:hypothetical protein
MHRQAPLTAPSSLYRNQQYPLLAIALNFNQRSILWKSIQKCDRNPLPHARQCDESCLSTRSSKLLVIQKQVFLAILAIASDAIANIQLQSNFVVGKVSY